MLTSSLKCWPSWHHYSQDALVMKVHLIFSFQVKLHALNLLHHPLCVIKTVIFFSTMPPKAEVSLNSLRFLNLSENWWELKMDPKSKPFSQPPPQSTDHGVCIFHFSHGQNRALIHLSSKSQPNCNISTWNILINYVLSKKIMHRHYELISMGQTYRHQHIQLCLAKRGFARSWVKWSSNHLI